MAFKQIEFLVKSWWMKNAMIETGRQVAKHTCQLFYITGDKYQPRGTGVLFECDGRYFLISAGHVLKCLITNSKPDRPFYVEMGIPNGESLIFVSGQLEVTDEGADIGMIELQNEVIEDLKKTFTFLTKEQLAIDHPGVATMQYLISGFPISSTWLDKKTGRIKARTIHLTTRIVVQPSVGELPKWQTCYSYDRNAAVDSHSGQFITGPPAKGISGGGAWFVEVDNIGGLTHNHKLVGIATQHVEPFGNVIITTKVDVVTEALRQKFGLNIPQSKTVKVNLS